MKSTGGERNEFPSIGICGRCGDDMYVKYGIINE
jgi:hypothetical protein